MTDTASRAEKAAPQPQTLRSKFCDAIETGGTSPAQEEANREMRHPRQSAPRRDEPFESHGMN
jgi:hypothetical protein